MAFYKVRQHKKTQLYYPQAVVVGKQVTTRQLATMLADRSTVTLSDTLAVLSELGSVMSSYMAQGRSVHLDGLGSFRYTINATKQGVEKVEDVSANQIRGIRVRFVPEVTRNMDRTVATRSMQPVAVDWTLWGKELEKKPSEPTAGDEGNDGGDDGGSSGGNGGSGESNPL